MVSYEYVKVGNLFHRVIKQTDKYIECDTEGITEEELCRIQNERALRDNPLAWHWYQQYWSLKKKNQ